MLPREGFGAGCLCVSVMAKSSLRLQCDIHAFLYNPSMSVSDIREAVVCIDSVICKFYTVLMLSFHTSLHLFKEPVFTLLTFQQREMKKQAFECFYQSLTLLSRHIIFISDHGYGIYKDIVILAENSTIKCFT